jgi:hypothetical protein
VLTLPDVAQVALDAYEMNREFTMGLHESAGTAGFPRLSKRENTQVTGRRPLAHPASNCRLSEAPERPRPDEVGLEADERWHGRGAASHRAGAPHADNRQAGRASTPVRARGVPRPG